MRKGGGVLIINSFQKKKKNLFSDNTYPPHPNHHTQLEQGSWSLSFDFENIFYSMRYHLDRALAAATLTILLRSSTHFPRHFKTVYVWGTTICGVSVVSAPSVSNALFLTLILK
eukprot:m.75358 g.75358  ORF g.75358 m.75358 type:complete len:114 (-) comp8478_c0_seq3:2740-3081(-)